MGRFAYGAQRLCGREKITMQSLHVLKLCLEDPELCTDRWQETKQFPSERTIVKRGVRAGAGDSTETHSFPFLTLLLRDRECGGEKNVSI